MIVARVGGDSDPALEWSVAIRSIAGSGCPRRCGIRAADLSAALNTNCAALSQRSELLTVGTELLEIGDDIGDVIVR
jgi:hypothetical protein